MKTIHTGGVCGPIASQTDEDRDQLFLAMELLEGQPLSEKMRLGPLSPHDAFALLLPVLEVLEALHARGIVHPRSETIECS